MVELLYTDMRHTGITFYISRGSRERRKYIYVSALEKRMKVKLRYKRILIYVAIQIILWIVMLATHTKLLMVFMTFVIVMHLFVDLTSYGEIKKANIYYYLYSLFRIKEILKDTIKIDSIMEIKGREWLCIKINNKTYNIYITKKTQKGLNDFLDMCKNMDEGKKARIKKRLIDIE